jgi:two-component system, NarL family, sensor histidine kinase DesK
MDINPPPPPWWLSGWRRLILPALPLVYLVYLIASITQNSRGAAADAGYAIVAAFAVCWLILVAIAPKAGPWFWVFYGVLVALFVAELPFGRAASFVLAVFVTIVTVIKLGTWSVPVVGVLTLAALFLPVAIGSWHVSLVGSFDDVTPIAIPIVAIVMLGLMQVVRSNQELARTRAQLARLAAENERSRIARDLHDLLGHSLTTITVKSGLARSIGATDPARALSEIAEVEALARRSLADVRAAVAGYREVTLSGELAAGRELLRAAGITADLPRATDVVDPAHHELFGWVVREGLTNVVRHAHATSCAVQLFTSRIEITDDGSGLDSELDLLDSGSGGASGHGLSGLRERVGAVGGVVEAGPMRPRGWRLAVCLPDGVGVGGLPGGVGGLPGGVGGLPADGGRR